MKFTVDSGIIENLEIYKTRGGKFISMNSSFMMNGISYIFKNMPDDMLDPNNDYIREEDSIRVIHRGSKSSNGSLQVISIKNFRNGISLNSDISTPIIVVCVTIVAFVPVLLELIKTPRPPIFIWLLVAGIAGAITLPLGFLANMRYTAMKLNEK